MIKNMDEISKEIEEIKRLTKDASPEEVEKIKSILIEETIKTALEDAEMRGSAEKPHMKMICDRFVAKQL